MFFRLQFAAEIFYLISIVYSSILNLAGILGERRAGHCGMCFLRRFDKAEYLAFGQLFQLFYIGLSVCRNGREFPEKPLKKKNLSLFGLAI